MIPRIISVSNLKGGAGKSTIAVNLACAIRARTGIDTILVDADRQATALKWAEAGSLGIRVTSRVLHEAKPEERHPGLMWVTQIRILADKNPSVVIDLPPGLEYSLAAVAAISDMILVPVNPSGVDFHSTAAFIDLVQKTRRIRHSDKPRSIIVPNRLDRRTVIARKMSLYEQFGEPISPPIGMRSAFVYAFDHGQWVGDFAPRSAAHKEIEHLVNFIITSTANNAAAAIPAAASAPSPAGAAPVALARAIDPKPQGPSEDAAEPSRAVEHARQAESATGGDPSVLAGVKPSEEPAATAGDDHDPPSDESAIELDADGGDAQRDAAAAPACDPALDRAGDAPADPSAVDSGDDDRPDHNADDHADDDAFDLAADEDEDDEEVVNGGSEGAKGVQRPREDGLQHDYGHDYQRGLG